MKISKMLLRNPRFSYAINPFCVFFISLLCATALHAGENLQGAMRAQQQRQQLIQQQVVAQKVAQQRQAIVQQQQLMIQERQQVIQQQQIAYQKALQQKQKVQQLQAYQQRTRQQRQAYNQAVQQKAAQEVAYRQVTQQQAFQQNLEQRNAQNQAYMNAAKENLLASQAAMAASAQTQVIQPTYQPSEADQITDLEHIWKDLEISSEIWPLMMDREPKELTVNRFIESYKKTGINIRKPASQYVDIIDSMTSDPNSPMLKTPFKDVLKVAAIVEYDFDNGLDKDQMAMKVLGQQGYAANKKRLGR